MTLREKFVFPAILVYRVYMYIRGLRFLKKLIAEKHDDEIYLGIHYSIGDALYGLSNLKSLRERYPEKKIVVISSEHRMEILSAFDCIDRLVLLKAEDFKKLQHFLFFRILAFIGFRYGIINAYIAPYYSVYKKVSFDDNRKAVNLFRKILGLQQDSPVTYHNINRITVNSIENFEQIKDRTVIINPYSVSIKTTMSIYETFCDELIRRGYTVFTNTVGEQEAVKGSLPLKCSIQELYSIACDIPLVVSVRSGVLDLMIPSGVSMFVVYDHASILMKEVYRLDGWESKCRIQEVIVDSDEDIVSLPVKFSAFLDELKAEGRLS